MNYQNNCGRNCGASNNLDANNPKVIIGRCS